jgi:Tol biopolymer transport system component
MLLIVCTHCHKRPSDEIDPNDPHTKIDYFACWSGVHDLIAYYHYQNLEFNDPDSTGIYVIRPDGTEKRKISDIDFVSGMDWSDDGTWLVINTHFRLVKLDYATGDIDTLTSSGEYFTPSISPNGEYIAYVWRGGDNRGIYMMKSDGTNHSQVVGLTDNVDWAYGDSLIYLNYRDEFPIGAICMTDTSGHRRRVIFEPSSTIMTSSPTPKFHQATKRIIFECFEDGETYSIWRKDWARDNAVELKEVAITPNFSPNGNQIIFTDLHYGNGRLYIINWDGSGLRQLTH